jgi:hypothetical protein
LKAKIEQQQDQINEMQSEIDAFKRDHGDMPLLISHS